MNKKLMVDMKNFNNPDEVRTFPKGRLELVTVAGCEIGHAIFEPGWIWSKSVQPLVQTCSCEAPHFQYQLSGELAYKMDDGTEYISRAGDVAWFPSGHDAWVVGDEAVELVDFNGMSNYANELEVLVKDNAERIRIAEEQRRLILTSVTDGIIGLDNNGKITFINPAALLMLGYKEEELIDKSMHIHLHHTYPEGEVFPREQCSMYKTSQDGIPRTVDNEVLWCKDGTCIPIEYSTTPIFQNKLLTGTVIVYRDITKRKKVEEKLRQQQNELEIANEKLRRLATIDELTNIPNRRLFNKHLKQELLSSQRAKTKISLIICDIDNFKKINDTYGHQVGDDCLYCIAQTIQSCLKRPKDLVTRFGGEEFAIILPETSDEQAAIIAEAIRKSIMNIKESTDSLKFSTVTLSFGVSMLNDEILSAEDLIKSADKALYKAKELGKECVVIDR